MIDRRDAEEQLSVDLSYLREACATHDIVGRLQQIFLDADELASDISSALQGLRQIQDAISLDDAEAISPSIASLVALLSKLNNVKSDFRVHYVMTELDQEAAGIQRIARAVQNNTTQFNTK